MGYAMAEAAQRRGARVILVSAPTALRAPAQCEVIPVTTTEEMRQAVLSRLDQATIVIKSAAVADYRPKVQAGQKMRRSGPLTLDLEPTGDILREVVELRRPGMLVIGFAAETDDALSHGREKLLRKGVDAIVLNDVSREGIGFDSDRNAVTFLTQDRAMEMPEMPKRELADHLLDEIMALRRPRHVLAEADTQ
jgi:phosphopantothenoylcysteine decarboxylase/phosphopantothenate--cysteine ligase